MTDKFPEVELIYCGQRETSKGALAYTFVTMDQAKAFGGDPLNLDTFLKNKSLFSLNRSEAPRTIGGIYRIGAKIDADTGQATNIQGTFKPTGDRFGVKAIVAALEHRHDATLVARRARKEDEKMRADKKLSQALAPFKARWTETDAIGRLALEVVILAELRR